MVAMAESLSYAKARVRDAAASAAEKGLDHAVAEVESALVSMWLLERQGSLSPRQIPDLALWLASTLKKIAPPPPKRVKFSDPIRKILPLAETGARTALDAAMIFLALTQVGDFTETSDKARRALDLFVDDWRRMIWESARITEWKLFRDLVNPEERILEGRLSRDAALRILEAVAQRRQDNITPIPDLSILACARCGRFNGRDRVRCSKCRGSFCAKCIAPAEDLCLPDYAARYAAIDPARRRQIAGHAAALLKGYRLDEHARNQAFARALHEEGVEVSFAETAPLEGQELEGSQGRLRLLVRDRESPSTKRALFRALARCYFRAAGGGDRLLEDYFVDVCMRVPVDEALGPQQPSAAESPAPG